MNRRLNRMISLLLVLTALLAMVSISASAEEDLLSSFTMLESLDTCMLNKPYGYFEHDTGNGYSGTYFAQSGAVAAALAFTYIQEYHGLNILKPAHLTADGKTETKNGTAINSAEALAATYPAANQLYNDLLNSPIGWIEEEREASHSFFENVNHYLGTDSPLRLVPIDSYDYPGSLRLIKQSIDCNLPCLIITNSYAGGLYDLNRNRVCNAKNLILCVVGYRESESGVMTLLLHDGAWGADDTFTEVLCNSQGFNGKDYYSGVGWVFFFSPIVTYKDVQKDWAYDGIDYCLIHGIMNGVSTTDKIFNPNGTMTRAMMVAILHRAAGEPWAFSKNRFADVDPSAWYARSVTWAYDNGITTGTSEDHFSPDEPVTRQQFATFLYRYSQQMKTNDNYDGQDYLSEKNYTDQDSVAEYAVPAMNWAIQNGIITSTTATGVNQCSPNGNLTRAMAATMIMRFLTLPEPPVNEYAQPGEHTGQEVAELAKSLVGSPYYWSGTNPSYGFDSAGLAYYVYHLKMNYDIRRFTEDMVEAGAAVSESEMEPGDLIVFEDNYSNRMYTGIYIGDGMMVHVLNNQGVVTNKYDYDSSMNICTIRRIVY